MYAIRSYYAVLCGSALRNIAIHPLLDMINFVLPDPSFRGEVKGTNPKKKTEEARPISVDAPFSAQVFKTLADPYAGKLSIFKVRITSYNVCYTKLLRGGACWALGPGGQGPEKQGVGCWTVSSSRGNSGRTIRRFCPCSCLPSMREAGPEAPRRITSYNVCYTKLLREWIKRP